jgi:tripartite-type tricarboxylate transporter receptor subunit TctC
MQRQTIQNERKEIQMRKIIFVLFLVSIIAVAGAIQASAAESAAEFYKGKVITFHVTSTAGANDDLWARTLSVHLPEFTGAKFAVKNDPAGGGRVLQNAFASTIEADGLHVMWLAAGTFWPAFMASDPAVKFDITKFQYIGGVESQNPLIAVSPKGKIKTLDDLRKAKGLVFAASNRTSLLTYANALVMEILNLDGKIVVGFPGASGRALALQQGDADGLVTSPSAGLAGVKDGIMKLLVQVGTNRTEPLMEIPCMMDLVKADTLNENQKRLIASIDILTDGKFAMAPPGTPPDRMAFLTSAIKKALESPALKAAMIKTTGDEAPPYVSGEALSKMAKGLAARKSDMKIWDDLLNKHIKK